MSDLERQEISTSVDNVEVEDVMAMGAKRQGDTNKMELEATDLPLDTEDPLDWTVDQVVAILCHSLSTPWINGEGLFGSLSLFRSPIAHTLDYYT
jgi:hypothetical protein